MGDRLDVRTAAQGRWRGILASLGMIAGIFFGLMFGLGGLGSAFFGWLADRTSIEFIFQVSTLLPLLGVITGFLPNIESKSGK